MKCGIHNCWRNSWVKYWVTPRNQSAGLYLLRKRAGTPIYHQSVYQRLNVKGNSAHTKETLHVRNYFCCITAVKRLSPLHLPHRHQLFPWLFPWRICWRPQRWCWLLSSSGWAPHPPLQQWYRPQPHWYLPAGTVVELITCKYQLYLSSFEYYLRWYLFI